MVELWEEVLRCGLEEMKPFAFAKNEEKAMFTLYDGGISWVLVYSLLLCR